MATRLSQRAASLTEQRSERGSHILATIARYIVAIPVLFFSVEQGPPFLKESIRISGFSKNQFGFPAP